LLRTEGRNTHLLLTASTLLVASLAAVGCGGSTPPAKSPSNDTAQGPKAPSPPAAPSASSQTPQPTSVSISDEIRSRCGIPDADAYFQFDSARVTSADRTPLDKVATCFTRGPLSGHSVKLVGRADPRGPTDYNMTLGESRADAVASYLGSHGMAKDKTLSTSRGAMDADGTDERGWQHDRRVDVLLGN
jgi:peptidoglycan-associated lipoprotein